MTSQVCISCGKSNKIDTECGICSSPVCRGCRVFLDEATFSFLEELPSDLKHNFYCPACYDEKVLVPLEKYQQDMESAREVFVFFVTGKREVPTLKKSLTSIQVKSCADRDETILRLAFKAVRLGFNALIQTEVTSAKVRDHGYQKSNWQGKAIPVLVDADRMTLEYERAHGRSD